MKIFNIIGISIYLTIAIILAIRHFRLNQAFRQNKIKPDQFNQLAKRNILELIAVVIFALLFVYTPFKLFII
ncbi:hypothetical protein [Lactobacillus intestinalis]|uniref:G-protein coupled receptors family 1 profile domain-containing protein n=1 Tax=Lactobacillus intestinalis TaxID=151781 RepID=A0A4S2BPE3_9LACO|nr:hypothetical protein [Lactobacillus intestinalis]KAI4315810.1 hypothetical protein C821_000205 [Lactobacillus intestinalis]TGY16838.1 hypothetical protein E5351_02260 [Lactobacillus intestinalis]